MIDVLSHYFRPASLSPTAILGKVQYHSICTTCLVDACSLIGWPHSSTVHQTHSRSVALHLLHHQGTLAHLDYVAEADADTHGPTPQVAMLMISEFGIFPEVCGWFVDVCSLQLFGSTLESRFAFWKAHYHISTALVRPFVS